MLVFSENKNVEILLDSAGVFPQSFAPLKISFSRMIEGGMEGSPHRIPTCKVEHQCLPCYSLMSWPSNSLTVYNSGKCYLCWSFITISLDILLAIPQVCTGHSSSGKGIRILDVKDCRCCTCHLCLWNFVFVYLFKLPSPKVLHGAVQTTRDTHRPVLLEKERKSIFLNMSAIYSLNSDLLMELENRLENW